MKIDMTQHEAAAIVATACGTFQSEEVDEVIFVVKRRCPSCRLPHILTVFGTVKDQDEAIIMLSRSITRIVDEGVFDV